VNQFKFRDRHVSLIISNLSFNAIRVLIHGKNGFAEISKKLDTDLKIILFVKIIT